MDSVPPMGAMMQMLTGGWLAGALGVMAELRVADAIGDGPRGIKDIAKTVGADERALYRLLRCLASVGVLREGIGAGGATFALTELGQLLRSDAAGSLRDVAVFFASHHCQRPWEMGAFSVRTGGRAFDHMYGTDAWTWYAKHSEDAAVFNNAMTALAATMHAAAVEAYDFSRFATLVDVGGGHGQLLAEVLKRNVGLRGVVFDQPHVVSGAGAVFEKMGVSDRASVEGGSFFEKIGTKADAYMMAHILHDWDDESCGKILKTVHAAAKEGATLLVFDAVIKGPNEADFGKLLDLEMLLVPGGRERTAEEFHALLGANGWKVKRVLATKSSVGIVESVRA